MIRNGGGLIDVTLCDGFLYCASVFSKSIAKATFSFPGYVLDPAIGALYPYSLAKAVFDGHCCSVMVILHALLGTLNIFSSNTLSNFNMSHNSCTVLSDGRENIPLWN